MDASTGKRNKGKLSDLTLADSRLITDQDSGDEDIELGEDFHVENYENGDESDEYDSNDDLPLAQTQP